jgi:hypothetical protein
MMLLVRIKKIFFLRISIFGDNRTFRVEIAV